MMNELNKLQDLLQMEMKNQSLYNKYMVKIQYPEVRQMFRLMRDGKVQQINQLQQDIKNMMAYGSY
jgi:ferritin-like metal-binding protein YciE